MEHRLFAPERPQTATEGARKAQQFFRSMGCHIDQRGFIEPLTPAQLDALAAWRQDTMPDGIEMETEETFYAKTLLATSLWPQYQNGTINYLLGKGIGVEIALRGKVVGREKRPVEFSYRTHSDFELYAADEALPENFRQVFGAQERYPRTKTKGLHDLPPHLLHETAEVVDFGGTPVLIPELELLFLDKYIAQESTPRAEGTDAEVLARQYALDEEKIHAYLEEYSVKPNIEHIASAAKRAYSKHLEGITRNMRYIAQELGARTDLPTRTRALNQKIHDAILVRGEDSNMVISGIALMFWEPITPNQMDETGVVTDNAYLERLQQRIADYARKQIAHVKNRHEEIREMLERIDSSHSHTS